MEQTFITKTKLANIDYFARDRLIKLFKNSTYFELDWENYISVNLLNLINGTNNYISFDLFELELVWIIKSYNIEKYTLLIKF